MQTVTSKLHFIRKVFGKYEMSRDGLNVSVKCPACRHPLKKKLCIRLDTDIFHCWVCGMKGRNLVSLLRKHGNQAALNEYLNEFLDDDKLSGEKVESVIVELPSDFRPLAGSTSIDPDSAAVRNYLFNRGLTHREFWYFRMGTSNRPDMRRRVIIPSFDTDGHLNYFVTRTIDSDTFPKYVNCKADRNEIVFNELNVDWAQPVTLVEGPFDLVRCNFNATCLLGSLISQKSRVFHMIVRNSTPVMLALDADATDKANYISRILSEFGVCVKIVPLGKHHDVGEMTRNEFTDALGRSSEWTRWGSTIDRITSISSSCVF